MRLRIATLALLLSLPGPAAAQPAPESARPSAPISVFQPRDETEFDYPDHPGRGLAFGFCASCHGFRIVAAQGMTREQWDSSLAWMTERHNMPAIETADRLPILDYLATAFPPKEPTGGRPGW